jgi:hypothetical protein
VSGTVRGCPRPAVTHARPFVACCGIPAPLLSRLLSRALPYQGCRVPVSSAGDRVGTSGTVRGWTCVSVWGATQFVTHGRGGGVRRLSQRQEQQSAVLSELTSSRSHGLGRRTSLADALRQRPVNETRMNLGAARCLRSRSSCWLRPRAVRPPLRRRL